MRGFDIRKTGMKRQNIRTLSLIVCTLTYLLVGAAVFDALESENELKLRQQAQRVKARIVEKYNITENDYLILESIIVKAIPHKAGHQWKFMGALYYSITVISTIGYGHSTPMTVGGKTFTMLYAISGIPLGLIMFQSIGERLNTFVATLLRGCKKCVGRKPNVNHVDLITSCSVLSFVLIAGGAYVFHKYEKWTYFDSIYYCFTTLTTIGFGDFVALQQNGALESYPEYFMFSLIFIVLGLVLVGAAMNLLVLRFLTLNTEDEKRDKRQAKLAERGLVRIDSFHDGKRRYSSRSDSEERSGAGDDLAMIPVEAETISVYSCSCYELPYQDGQETAGIEAKRFSVRSKSGKEIRSVDDLLGDSQGPKRRKGHSKRHKDKHNHSRRPSNNLDLEAHQDGGQQPGESPSKKLQRLHRQFHIVDDYPPLLHEASSSLTDIPGHATSPAPAPATSFDPQRPHDDLGDSRTAADDLLRARPRPR